MTGCETSNKINSKAKYCTYFFFFIQKIYAKLIYDLFKNDSVEFVGYDMCCWKTKLITARMTS